MSCIQSHATWIFWPTCYCRHPFIITRSLVKSFMIRMKQKLNKNINHWTVLQEKEKKKDYVEAMLDNVICKHNETKTIRCPSTLQLGDPRFNHHQRVSWQWKWKQYFDILNTAVIYLFKLNNGKTGERHVIKRHRIYVNYVVVLSLLFTLKKFYSLFAPYSGASIVELEQKNCRLWGSFCFFFHMNGNIF